MYSLKIIFAVLLCIERITSKCIFTDFDYNNPPLFAYTIDKKEIFFRPTSSSILIGEGSEISAYCKSNFAVIEQNGKKNAYTISSTPTYQFTRTSYMDKIFIRCHKHRLSIRTDDIPIKYLTYEYIEPLSCIQTVSLFQAKSSYCDKQMLAIALDIEEQPKFLGDVCYDPESFETIFVHYSTDNMMAHPDLFVFRDALVSTDFLESNSKRTNIINKSLNQNWPKQYKSHSYRFDALVPTEELTQNYSTNLNYITSNSIPWWTNLKDGNWKDVEEMTNHFTILGHFDIYTGISHTFESDTNFAKYLQYSVNFKRLQIPLYVWKYIKSKYPYDAHHEVVIIGINYPFLTEDEIHRLQFCPDVCDHIHWLRGSLQFRRVPTFGYVFCCKVNDARQRIPIIQKIQYAFRNVFQEEP